MKNRRIALVVFLVLGISMGLAFSAPIAEDSYQKIQAMDLATESMETIRETYDDFYGRVAKIADNARADMAKARAAGDVEAYREAYGRYSDLSKYVMTEQDTERLLARILQEPEERRAEFASWLQARSRYYRPTLTIDFSTSGESYRYSYRQRVRQVPGTTITLPDSSDLQFDSSRIGLLSGWGITPDEVTYQPGEEISMPLTNQTLYAIWTTAVQFSDGTTGFSEIHSPVSPGESIAVPSVSSPDPSYRFIGWYDRTTGTLLDEEETFEVEGKGATFEGVWKQLSIESISPLYYGFDRLPTNTQIAVGFMIANGGNIALRDLTARLETDNPDVRFLCDTMAIRDLPAGRFGTNNSRVATMRKPSIGGEGNTFRFVIDERVPSGTTIPFTLTIEDRDGELWHSKVSFSVR